MDRYIGYAIFETGCIIFLWLDVAIALNGCTDKQLCCEGTDNTCNTNGCYCDEYCLVANDCCDDYLSFCQNGDTTTHSFSSTTSGIEGKTSCSYSTSHIYFKDYLGITRFVLLLDSITSYIHFVLIKRCSLHYGILK